MPDDVILETEGLTKEFRGFVAVNDVDLSVRRGTIHGLIGPNGAGKTTCFNLLTKFLQPTRGTIRYDGRDITGMKPAEVARLGLVRSFQISAVFPHLSVLENVRVALQRQRGGSFDFWRTEGLLRQYDDRLCADISALVLRNRGAGPFGLLGLVDERCGGVFEHIDEIIPPAERDAFMARYKAAAGLAIETLNAAPPTIAPGARVGG